LIRLPRAHVRPVDSPQSDHARWFAAEVQPHSAPLRSYLRRAFPSVPDVDDVVQESLLRLWRVRAGQPIRSARAFLFGVARRLAIDVIRGGHAAPLVEFSDAAAVTVLDAALDPAEAASLRHEMALLAAAIDTLPARCREIVVLRKLDGLTHREIAARLGLAEETVQVQIGRGMDKIALYLRRHGVARDGRPRP
jgi:RNA polymerase sigma-70 factor (ECF subfamily)